jgi:signal transduction histidine kinase
MKTNLETAAERFADDFDAEIAAILAHFFPVARTNQPEWKEQFRSQFDLWIQQAPHPELIQDVLVARRKEGSGLDVQRIDRATMELSSSPWPDDFPPLNKLIELRRRPGAPGGPSPIRIIEESPALILPGGFARQRREARPRSWIIIRLDYDVVVHTILPTLTERYFGSGDELDYDVLVTSKSASRDPHYSSMPLDGIDAGWKADARVDLFSFRPDLVPRQVWPREILPPDPGRRAAPRIRDPRPFGRILAAMAGEGLWELTVRHRAGSLEAAVRQVRRRNLFVSFAVLSLLAVSVIMMVLSTRRAQELARQKIEFVAGVSHELKTPLTVIRSAGQNLAHGTVDDPEQVKRYGSLVEEEGRRLSGLVDQVMQFAGNQSDKGYNFETVALAPIVESALSDCRSLIEEKELEVECDIPEDLPAVYADSAAIRRAVANLIDNAVKYAGREKWIGLKAGVDGKSSGSMVFLRVADRGPGIDRADLSHLFEPFYRGKGVRQIRGSGLGLSLVQQIVEAHRGRVSVETGRGEGATFIIFVPKATGEKK